MVLIPWVATAASGAVDATLTPSTTSSASATPVVLHVTGLANGEPVTVERYVDANANGTVDAGEFLAETFTVTDGQVTSIGGVRNTNMPGDENLAADGLISINLHPARGTELGRVAGPQLIRISSPTAAFPTFIRTLNLTNPAQAQSITGTVTDGTNPVPYATVILLDAATDGEFALGVVADASGVYTAPAPVGSYMVLPFKHGYVASFPPPTVLEASAAPAQDLVLTAATTSIAGKVADAGTNAGLGGVQLFVQSMGDQVTLISTSLDGTYSVPVTADNWQIEPSEISFRQLGYLTNQNGKVTADANVSSVSGADLNVDPVTALIHGTVADAEATPLAGIRINANDSNNTYFSDATTDANGHYVLGVTSGSWSVHISSQSPGLAGYIIPNNQSATISGAQAAQQDFTLLATNAHLVGTVTNADTSLPIAAITISAYNQSTNQFISVQTAPDGTFDLGLVPGTWMVQIQSSSAASFNIVSPSFNYTLIANQTISGIAFAAKPATAQINGLVGDADNGNQAIAGANVFANATINSVPYAVSAQTNGSGNYVLPVINGTWQVGAFASSYTSPNLVATVVSGSNVTRNFALTKGPVIAFQPIDHTAAAGQTFVFSLNVNGAGVTYQWQVSTDNGNIWANLADNSTYSTATANVLNVTANAGLNGYRYRCIATNAFGAATSNPALLTVNSSLQITTLASLPNGVAGSVYSTQLNAAGGLPPYHWYLPGGTITLPPGSMSLSDDGILSGIPMASGTYSFSVGAGNSDWSGTVTQLMSLTINPTPAAAVITSQPSNQSAVAGQNAVFSVVASGLPAPTYQWQISTDDGFNWNPLANDAFYSGVDTASLTVIGATVGQDRVRFRVMVTNTGGSVSSTHAILTVSATSVAPEFTTQPSDLATSASQNAAFTVVLAGTPTPSIQWQVSTDNGAIWNDLANGGANGGVNSATLTINASIGLNGYRYRAVATNLAGTVNSNAATLTVSASATNTVVAWGAGGVGQSATVHQGQSIIPSGLGQVTAIVGGGFHTVVLRSDGTVAAWGYNARGETTIPAGLSGVIAVAAGDYHSVALKGDGTVVAWGYNGFGETTIPVGLSGVSAITANGSHTVALKSDGTVVAWGLNDLGQATVPVGLSGVTAIAAGSYHTVALKNDGTVVAWGVHYDTQSGNRSTPAAPAGLNGVTAIAAGIGHTLALKNDGTVVAWGYNGFGQATVPAGLSGVVAIAAGMDHSVAMKSDGTVVAWGYNAYNQATVPAGLSGAMAISAGYYHTLALIGTPPVITGQPSNQTVTIGMDATFTTSASAIPSPTLQWQVSTNGGSNWSNLINDSAYAGVGTATLTVIAPLIGQNSYLYRVVATNVAGSASSNGALLTVHAASTSFSSWAQTYFTPIELLDANVSGPNAIYGPDGLPNLVKYALGLDPMLDANSGLPEVSTTATDWVYTYTRPIDRTDITYAVEVSTNLTTWGAPATAAVLISTTGDVETWQARHPLASATNAYFRLRVTQL